MHLHDVVARAPAPAPRPYRVMPTNPVRSILGDPSRGVPAMPDETITPDPEVRAKQAHHTDD